MIIYYRTSISWESFLLAGLATHCILACSILFVSLLHFVVWVGVYFRIITTRLGRSERVIAWRGHAEWFRWPQYDSIWIGEVLERSFWQTPNASAITRVLGVVKMHWWWLRKFGWELKVWGRGKGIIIREVPKNENETYRKALDTVCIDNLLNVLSAPTVPIHNNHGKSCRKECGAIVSASAGEETRSFAQYSLSTLRRHRTFPLEDWSPVVRKYVVQCWG